MEITKELIEVYHQILETITENLEPEQLYGWDRMEAWAKENGFEKGEEWRSERKCLYDKID